LILYGKTASGSVVRNRFFWTYSLSCADDNIPLVVGDGIGWVTVVRRRVLFHVQHTQMFFVFILIKKTPSFSVFSIDNIIIYQVGNFKCMAGILSCITIQYTHDRAWFDHRTDGSVSNVNAHTIGNG